jgi:hypothetical protein
MRARMTPHRVRSSARKRKHTCASAASREAKWRPAHAHRAGTHHQSTVELSPARQLADGAHTAAWRHASEPNNTRCVRPLDSARTRLISMRAVAPPAAAYHSTSARARTLPFRVLVARCSRQTHPVRACVRDGARGAHLARACRRSNVVALTWCSPLTRRSSTRDSGAARRTHSTSVRGCCVRPQHGAAVAPQQRNTTAQARRIHRATYRRSCQVTSHTAAPHPARSSAAAVRATHDAQPQLRRVSEAVRRR